MHYCSLLDSKFLLILSKNYVAFSLCRLKSSSLPSKSKTLAPTSVISVVIALILNILIILKKIK